MQHMTTTPQVQTPSINYSASIEGHGRIFFNNSNDINIITGYRGDATVYSTFEKTTLFCIGRGDVTAYFGDGRNNAFGGVGNDTFFGGDGTNNFFGGAGNDFLYGGNGRNNLSGGTGNDTLYGGDGWNKLSGGAGDDLLIGGRGFNDMNGGDGNDTLFFGQGDQVSGGRGADNFFVSLKANMPFTGNVFINDFSVEQGDRIDLTALQGVTREFMKLNGDTLEVSTPEGILQIDGVGIQITLVGGIDNAIHQGLLAFDNFDGKG